MLIINVPVKSHRQWVVMRINFIIVEFLIKINFMKRYFVLALLLPTMLVQSQNWAKQYDYVDDCICGLAKVNKDGKFGYVDLKGNLVIPLIYQDAMTFNEGYAAVKLDNKWGFVDSTGKVIIGPEYEEAGSFFQNLSSVRKNGKFGFIDTGNKIMVPFVYNLASGFSEGLAAVQNEKDLWGYINLNGKTVITFVYSFAGRFEDGKARVMKGSNMRYIDKSGNEVEEE